MIPRIRFKENTLFEHPCLRLKSLNSNTRHFSKQIENEAIRIHATHLELLCLASCNMSSTGSSSTSAFTQAAFPFVRVPLVDKFCGLCHSVCSFIHPCCKSLTKAHPWKEGGSREKSQQNWWWMENESTLFKKRIHHCNRFFIFE